MEKRTIDVTEIFNAISKLHQENKKITYKEISKLFGQTASNIQRIAKKYNIDLKPFQQKYKSTVNKKKQIDMNEYEKEIIARLKNIDTKKYHVSEIAEFINYENNVRALRRILNKHNIEHRTTKNIIKFLKSIDSRQYTLKQLHSLCDLNPDVFPESTFRTRLHEHNIPYKKVINRNFH